MSRSRNIIALGGGGFLMEPENLRLDRYIIAQTRLAFPKVDRIRICFVGTASGDADSAQLRYYRAMGEISREGPAIDATHLSLFWPPKGKSVRDFVFDNHIIYVGGGNTRAMLLLWKEWKLDLALREAYEAGIVMAGISAGAICWFEQGLSDSVTPGDLAPLDCLGILPGSFCPHYDGESLRRPKYQSHVANGSIKPGYAADDGAAAHFVDGTLHRVVTSRPDAKAFQLHRSATGEAVETTLESKFNK